MSEVKITLKPRETDYDNDMYSLLVTKKQLDTKLKEINPCLSIISNPGAEQHFIDYDLFVLPTESIDYKEEIRKKLSDLGSEIRYSIIEMPYSFMKREFINGERWDLNETKITIAIKRTAFHSKSVFSLGRCLTTITYYIVLAFLSYTLFLLIQ